MRYIVTSDLVVTDATGTLLAMDILEAILDEIYEQLVTLDGSDHDIGATLARGEVKIAVNVEASTPEGAAGAGGAIIRAAIHAAGGSTPDWSVDYLRIAAELDPDLVDA